MQLTTLKRRSVKILLEVVAILLIYLLLKTYLQRNLASGVAPEISTNLIDGTPVKLSQFRGKPVLLHFWASWCSICKLEQTSIQSLSQSFQVITVAMQSGEELEVSEYLQQNSLSFPTIADSIAEISRKYGVNAVPTSFVLDGDGKILFKETGYSSQWGLRFRLWIAGFPK